MPTIFVDESGSFKPCADQNYFVIASFTVGDPERTASDFKKWQKKKFPWVKRYQSEVKFSETGLPDDLRVKTIQYISSLDVRIKYGYLKCKHIPAASYDKHGLREGYLYTQILGEVLESYFPISDDQLMARCDKRSLKGLKKDEFVGILKARLVTVAPVGARVDIVQVDSTEDRNIQIADWIAGALASYLNGKSLGAKFNEILRANIIGSPIELFKSE